MKKITVARDENCKIFWSWCWKRKGSPKLDTRTIKCHCCSFDLSLLVSLKIPLRELNFVLIGGYIQIPKIKLKLKSHWYVHCLLSACAGVSLCSRDTNNFVWTVAFKNHQLARTSWHGPMVFRHHTNLKCNYYCVVENYK